MWKKAAAYRAKPSALVDTRVIYCGDNLEQLKKRPDGCVDLIYIAPAVQLQSQLRSLSGETKEKQPFTKETWPR